MLIHSHMDTRLILKVFTVLNFSPYITFRENNSVRVLKGFPTCWGMDTLLGVTYESGRAIRPWKSH